MIVNKRHFSKSLILLMLISWATISNAQNDIFLACVDQTDNYTLDVILKERAETVVISGMEVPANYTKTTIFYFQELNGLSYFHTINRGSGVLMILNTKTGVVLTPKMCSVTSKKF